MTPTEAGERLLSYARRLLSLAEEARDVMARPGHEGAVRLGIPEDFAAYRLAKLLAAFSRSHPQLRLDVRADQSVYLKRDLERGDLDLALFKRDAGEKGGIAVWPERVHWVTSKSHPRDTSDGLGAADRFSCRLPLSRRARSMRWKAPAAPGTWPIPLPSLAGIQAAVAAGMGLSILSEMAIQADHRVLTATRGLCADRQDRSGAGGLARRQPRDAAARRRLAEFCDTVQAKAA